MSLQGKNILLAVCGSIAAYKVASLIRLLVKAGADVQVVMTREATAFITPLTLSTLSKKSVLVDYYDPTTGEWNNHVHLALQADLLLVVPASANTLAKFAHGICDNLLTACYLSAKCPVLVAPAMDLDMWKHPSTLNNIELLKSYGNTIIPPGNGELASGLSGEGRLAEPEQIFDFLRRFIASNKPLEGKKALVTAGPTYEAIDPVRFIGNHSSGKMGYAIAKALYDLGAEVVLVSGPTALETPRGVRRRDVRSAREMFDACQAEFATSDIVVMSAAVADYTPVNVAGQKIKKQDGELSIALTKTVDILATLGRQKTSDQTLVGFALETNNEMENALDKLQRKNADFIVLNSMQDKGAGFATDTNKITVLHRDGTISPYDLKTKDAVAMDICALIVEHQIRAKD
jgi:phosphopantothenoylcysteine decarboxylase/phosphopantothenate--cysteine ligase